MRPATARQHQTPLPPGRIANRVWGSSRTRAGPVQRSPKATRKWPPAIATVTATPSLINSMPSSEISIAVASCRTSAATLAVAKARGSIGPAVVTPKRRKFLATAILQGDAWARGEDLQSTARRRSHGYHRKSRLAYGPRRKPGSWCSIEWPALLTRNRGPATTGFVAAGECGEVWRSIGSPIA